jgi:hypothetical protein
MSLYQTNKVIYDMKMDEAKARRFHADRAALLDEYELTEEERRALSEVDLAALYRAGVIPNLLLRLGMLARKD